MKTANYLFARLFTGMLTRIVFLITVIACTLSMSLASARDRLPEPAHAGLTAAWNLVGCGERYKQVWFGGEAVRGAGKTYTELLQSYNQSPTGSGCNEVDSHGAALKHIDYFVLASSAFQILVDSGLTGKNKNVAEWGLQESLNYLAEGKLLKGNDLLINGLRSRFKTDDSQTKTQIELLGDSVTEMKDGLAQLTPYMVGYGTVLRSKSDNPTERFPFLVENSQGPKVPNEYQRYAELLNRYGMAANSEAKYIYYKDNVNDVDNPPYKNFPGPEDLDFNNDRIQNQAGRLDAAKRAKKVGSHLYLQSLTLAVMQNAEDFQTNNGYQIKRQINDSDRLYQDIQSGFNPLLLAGDFVPYQRVENFLQLARARVNDATQAEQLARANQRTFETDETSLKTELRQQTSQYIDQLVELAGVSSADFDLTTKEGRDEYKTAAYISSMHERQGQIGIQVHALAEADLQLTQISTQMQVVNSRAKIELDRGESVATLVLANGKRISVLQFMNTMASCCNVSKGTSSGTSKGSSIGGSASISIGSSTSISGGISVGGLGGPTTNFGFSLGTSASISAGVNFSESEGKSWGTSDGRSRNPDVLELAEGQKALALLQSIQQAEIEGINSIATVKSILLEMATLNVSMEQADAAYNRQYATIETLYKKFERILANYAVAQEDFSEAYYNNPAYRVEASRAEQAAEDTFETALELSYYAAKSMEYMWSEKYNNPVLRLDGGLPEPLAVSFDPFVRAESVFSAQFASTYSPSLDDYLDGLQAWDVKMRQLRYPERQTSRVRFSMRDDLLGFGEFIPNVAEAKFRSFIDDKRNIGENVDNPDLQFEFSMDIADERLFPNHPNIKIESIAVNLVSTASRSIRGSSKTIPALVDLVMLDRAFIRTFFAEYPARDDILSYTLQQGRTIEKSPFIATVDATVDGYASPQVDPNTQLASHSPAVSTWVLRMKNNRFNNRDLKLQYLSDIEIDIQYSYGKPRDIQFSN
ncbi:MAG: hypothetical protein ACI910_001211 [Oleispira sp.]|jgi:hypothetical protein